MLIFLGILAALIVLPILLRVALRVFALLFVREAVIKAAEDVGQRALAQQADRIHLSKRGPQAWKRPDEAGALTLPLLENGFSEVGTYAIDEMPGLLVRLLTDERHGLLGIVYEHPRTPHWVELVTRYTDGSVATFTTVRPTGLSPRPKHKTVHAPGLDAGALLHRALGERPAGSFAPVNPATAVQQFEDSYAEYMAWRKRQGISAQEVVRVATRKRAA
jgi:hypothetical protein